MDERIRRALGRPQLIEITTTGRRTGLPRRVELGVRPIDGRLYVSGRPDPARRRAWLANLEADPRLTVHLKSELVADLPATARIISDEAERRAILERIARAWRAPDVERMVRYSPLIEVIVDEQAA